LEGETTQVEVEFTKLLEVIQESGAYEIRVAQDEAERMRIWKGRKSAFSAVGRLSPDYIVNDGVVPRSKLGHALSEIERLSAAYNIRVANVFHAGDGNLHPLILFDRRDKDELGRALDAATAVLKASIEQGGVISGEHGIGVEKRDYMTLLFTTEDLAAMAGLKQCFDPRELFNPGKVFPAGRGCGELAALRRGGLSLADFAGEQRQADVLAGAWL
jgi:glycolate oxidase